MDTTVKTSSPYSVPAMTYLPVLDGFRGLAVLLVIGFHYIPAFSWGWVGVDLFFVLSGCLITGKLMASARNKGWLAHFFARRFLRIAPLYFLMLIFMFAVLPQVGESLITPSFRQLLSQQVYYWTFTVNIYDAIHGWPANISMIHFWSLACEVQFYLLWPLVILAFHRRVTAMVWAMLVLMLVAIVSRIIASNLFDLHPIYRYVLLPCRLDAFILGALLQVFFRTPFFFLRSELLPWIGGLIAAIILYVALFISGNWQYTDPTVSAYGYTLNALFWMLMIAACLFAGPGILQNIFLNGALRMAGRYSYAMYVFHLPLLIFVDKIDLFGSAQDGTVGVYKSLVAFGGTVLLSVLSYHLLEKRIMRRKPT